METWKMFIESCIENNSSAYFMVHAYQTVWENFNPDAPAPVSMAESGLSWQEILENGDYPEEWCRPVNHPDDDPDTFMLPRPETGLDGDWSHWHPMPGTRLHALWEWIGWMQQQDLAFATPGRNYKWNGNIIETGYFMPLTQAGQARKRPWDSDDFDHFVIGIDGSIRYFKE